MNEYFEQFRYKPRASPAESEEPTPAEKEPWQLPLLPVLPRRPLYLAVPRGADNNVNKRLRCLVWEKYMGRVYEGKCYCCNDATIDVTNFHSGHVLAEKMGGAATVQNLRPICALCNLSGSVKHMRDFAEQNGFVGARILLEEKKCYIRSIYRLRILFDRTFLVGSR